MYDNDEGVVNIISGNISGTVTYVNADNPTVPVPNTNLNAVGSINRSTTSDSNGLYSLSGLGSGAYTVTPSKPGNVNGISSLDAVKISQHVVNLITLNSTQLIAADVSGNGQVTSFDAALVSQYVVHIPNPGFTGTWKFVPANRSYANVETEQTNQDYSAILLGDVTGNWCPTVPDQLFAATNDDSLSKERKTDNAASLSAATIGVNAPTNQYTSNNTNFVVPLNVQDTTGQGILSYQFILHYDSNVLSAPTSGACDVTGTISSSMSATCNSMVPGTVEVSVSGSTVLNGARVLLNIKFLATSAAGSSSPLTIQSFMFNKGIPQSSTTNGQVTISGPTAAASSIKGRIFTPEMRGLVNAFVTLTDSNGKSRTVMSNTFGNFTFENVPSGQSYIIQVKSKRYSFTPQVISVLDNISELYLIGQN